jgi:hypothetical protein
MPPILVASTIAPHKLSEQYDRHWLLHAEALRESHPDGVDFFCAVETDARGLDGFGPLLNRLDDLGGDYWTFSIDKAPALDGLQEITSGDRLIRITTGRNLGIDYALHGPYSHVLWLDTDTEPPPDALPRLLEVDRALVHGNVPTYCHGYYPDEHGHADYSRPLPSIPGLPGDCRAHWSTAGFLLVRRAVLRYVRWGHDPDAGLTDDPCTLRDAELVGRALGLDWAPVTRHDCQGQHWPASIPPIEFRGGDRSMVYR